MISLPPHPLLPTLHYQTAPKKPQALTIASSADTVSLHFGNQLSSQELFKKIRLSVRDPQSIERLVKSGIDVNIQDDQGCTPLIIAAYSNYLKTVKRLLEKLNADIHLPDYKGKPPLLHAVQSGHLEMVQLLLSKDADPSIPDQNQKTALWHALQLGKVGIISALLEACSQKDLGQKSVQGLSGLDYARLTGSIPLMKKLAEKARLPLSGTVNIPPALHEYIELNFPELNESLLTQEGRLSWVDHLPLMKKEDSIRVIGTLPDGYLKLFKAMAAPLNENRQVTWQLTIGGKRPHAHLLTLSQPAPGLLQMQFKDDETRLPTQTDIDQTMLLHLESGTYVRQGYFLKGVINYHLPRPSKEVPGKYPIFFRTLKVLSACLNLAEQNTRSGQTAEKVQRYGPLVKYTDQQGNTTAREIRYGLIPDEVKLVEELVLLKLEQLSPQQKRTAEPTLKKWLKEARTFQTQYFKEKLLKSNAT